MSHFEPVANGSGRPLWSVMIPTYNCAQSLRETLATVLAQDPGPERMHIEVVDHASTADDPEAVVDEVGKGRVEFYRKPLNEGAVANFNMCISRSRGELVHILHGDDFVTDGYYRAIERLSAEHPAVGLYATRCFYVGGDSIITGVTRRLTDMESPTSSPAAFFYENPLQFAGVTVRRAAYEKVGGFRPELVHTSDCEMWARVTAACSAVVSSEVRASYRISSGNETSRLAQTGENIRDLCRLADIFAERYPGFSLAAAHRKASRLAWRQYQLFRQLGDDAAARANHDLWMSLTPTRERAARLLRAWASFAGTALTAAS